MGSTLSIGCGMAEAASPPGPTDVSRMLEELNAWVEYTWGLRITRAIYRFFQ